MRKEQLLEKLKQLENASDPRAAQKELRKVFGDEFNSLGGCITILEFIAGSRGYGPGDPYIIASLEEFDKLKSRYQEPGIQKSEIFAGYMKRYDIVVKILRANIIRGLDENRDPKKVSNSETRSCNLRRERGGYQKTGRIVWGKSRYHGEF